MEFVDTHCHIQFDDYALDAEQVWQDGTAAGVTRAVVVGCTPRDSQQGVAFAEAHDGIFAAVGIHPHEADHYQDDTAALEKLDELAQKKATVAIGECGLDYYYNHASKESQRSLLERQLQLASDHNLPVLFHVRDAFDDFLPLFDNFSGVRGIVHSFTAGSKVLEKVINRGLYVGLNGIITFSKDEAQLRMAQQVPLNRVVLETDAPFLTPEPFRGKVCELKHVVETARFLSDLRGEPIEGFAEATTDNAKAVLKLV
jgi:TatD DNase family protein